MRRMSFATMLAAFGVGAPATEFRGVQPKAAYGRRIHSGGTFNAGRNEQKRRAREQQALSRQHAVNEYLWGYKKFRPAKTNCGAVVKMLSDRRLRQRGVAA